QPIRVAVYDALGREVARLHEGPLAAGTHRLTFDAADLPSGTYLIRAGGGGAVQTRAVTLVR
ncbi:MAG: T9SS type A sorting domain-containing protein, partial [Rhodothermales bacterium]|nr:T9SS type A sorting domain-containing protein [Rhodothermales bacterium]